MTFSMTMPTLVAVICFAVPFVICGSIACAKRDHWYWMPGVIVGAIAACSGLLFASIANDSIVTRKAAGVVAQKKQSILESMPDDWQGLHRLLQTVETTPLREAYVKDFLKGKSEPEISAEAYQAFYSKSECSQYSTSTCVGWKFWLAEKLAPFAHIDVRKAMGAAASPAKE